MPAPPPPDSGRSESRKSGKGMDKDDIDPEPNDDKICRCSGTTVAQIKKLFDRGVDDLDGISRATGACSGCGACDSDVLALLAEWRSAASGHAA
jgi:NAD(P)H-nitrite reductase large subunit